MSYFLPLEVLTSTREGGGCIIFFTLFNLFFFSNLFIYILCLSLVPLTTGSLNTNQMWMNNVARYSL